jgi:hypothetical protein
VEGIDEKLKNQFMKKADNRKQGSFSEKRRV